MTTPWFRREGWRWHPICWQGWVVTIVFITLSVFVVLSGVHHNPFSWDWLTTVLIPVIILLGSLLMIYTKRS